MDEHIRDLCAQSQVAEKQQNMLRNNSQALKTRELSLMTRGAVALNHQP